MTIMIITRIIVITMIKSWYSWLLVSFVSDATGRSNEFTAAADGVMQSNRSNGKDRQSRNKKQKRNSLGKTKRKAWQTSPSFCHAQIAIRRVRRPADMSQRLWDNEQHHSGGLGSQVSLISSIHSYLVSLFSKLPPLPITHPPLDLSDLFPRRSAY